MNSQMINTLSAGDDARLRAVDSLFNELASPGSAGLAVGVYQGGRAVLLRGYGYADLEHSVPNSPQTVFHVASVSKQFAAFSVAMLAREGKVDLDADIRRYLDFVPDFGHPITAQHLIHHTSGLRDQWELFRLGGQGLDNRLRQSQIVNMVARQRGLNFHPGTEFLYSNTGYTLLAEIVRSVTGRTLREFTTERIFRPLGMTRSFFYDDVTEIVPGRANSYLKGSDGRWRRALLSYDNVGATSLFSTAADMLKWVGNFAHPVVGDAAIIDQVCASGALHDGKEINYGFGLMRGTYAGRDAVFHPGGDAAFRAMMLYFPGMDFGLTILANYPVEDWGGLVDELALIFLNEHGDGTSRLRPATALCDEGLLRQLPGCYITEFAPFAVLERHADQLLWRSPGADFKPVVVRADGTFDHGDASRPWYSFRPQLSADGRVSGFEDLAAAHRGTRREYRRFEPIDPTPGSLLELAGDYRSPELDITYTLSVEDGHLTARSIWSSEAVRFTPSLPDRFDAQSHWMGVILFIRDGCGRPIGLRIHGERVRNIVFDRVVSP